MAKYFLWPPIPQKVYGLYLVASRDLKWHSYFIIGEKFRKDLECTWIFYCPLGISIASDPIGADFQIVHQNVVAVHRSKMLRQKASLY